MFAKWNLAHWGVFDMKQRVMSEWFPKNVLVLICIIPHEKVLFENLTLPWNLRTIVSEHLYSADKERGKCRFRYSFKCLKTHCAAHILPIWMQKEPKEA